MNKQELIKRLKKEMPGSISYFDIFSVVNILLDELKQEIINTGEVVIPNFGKLILKKFKPKLVKSVRTGKLQLTKAYTALRFTISKNVMKQLINNGVV